MRLAIHNSARVFGGNEKWFTLLSQGLMQRGHEVTVSCRAGGVVEQALRRRGIATVPVMPHGALDLPAALRFRGWLHACQPDAMLLTSWNRTFWGAWAARHAGVPRTVVRLGIVRALPRFQPVSYAFRHYVDAVIVNSANIRATLLESAPWFPADAVHLIMNGIATPDVDRAAARRELRASLGVAPDQLTVAIAGHIAHRKGVDVLLDALALPEAAGWHGVVIGEGPIRAELEQRARNLGVAERVSWLGHREGVPYLLAGCDAFAMCSRNEGMANVMLEAMSVGTPVVATDIAGVREAIGADASGRSAGWIIAPDAVAELATSLHDIQHDPDAARACATEALERIRTRFGIDRMVDEAERVLFPARSHAR